MNYVTSLIDKAAKVCGGQNALAERMGFSSGTLSDMKHGRKTVSPATAAELADIAGEDARQAAIDAVIESARGTRRESVLRDILGKGLVAGVAGMLAFSYSGDSISATEKIVANETAYTSCLSIFTYPVATIATWLRTPSNISRLPAHLSPLVIAEKSA